MANAMSDIGTRSYLLYLSMPEGTSVPVHILLHSALNVSAVLSFVSLTRPPIALNLRR